MSGDLRHPIRIPDFNSDDKYYPRELSIDSNNRLHFRNADDTADVMINANQADKDSKGNNIADSIELAKTTAQWPKVEGRPLINPGTGKNSILIGDNANAQGDYSHAAGYGTEAKGDFSHAEGFRTQAIEGSSHAEGDWTIAEAESAHAEGIKSKASGTAAHSEGRETHAIGIASHAEGHLNKATGAATHAEGSFTNAIGTGSHTEGKETTANGDYSHAEGSLTNAVGASSHAEGESTNASGESSHAEGRETTASGSHSHAEGYQTIASGSISHAEGRGTRATSYHAHAEGRDTEANGESSHAEGESTNASGESSHAEGRETTASGSHSHAEGRETEASGSRSHAEGYQTIASGSISHAEGRGTRATSYHAHAEGRDTEANGESSHAEGYNTYANGIYSHAEGYKTEASKWASHAEGSGTIASGNSQHVQGKYNITDEKSNRYAHIVGNGTSEKRSNAHTLDWDGNAWYAGDIEANNAMVNNIEATDAVLDGNLYLRRNYDSVLNTYNSSTTSDINSINITSSTPEGTMYIRPTRKYNLLYTNRKAGDAGTSASGVSYTIQDDGGFALSGTAAKAGTIPIFPEGNAFLLPPGSYEVYSMQLRYCLYDADGNQVKGESYLYAYASDGSRTTPARVTLESDNYILVSRCVFYIKSGSVYDGIVYYPYICRKDGREANIKTADNRLYIENKLVTDINEFYGIAPITFTAPASNKLNLDVVNEKAYIDDVEYTDIDSSIFTKLKGLKTENVCEYNDYDNLIIQIKDNYILPSGSINYIGGDGISDWFENDPNCSSHIKNRTHYYKKNGLLLSATINGVDRVNTVPEPCFYELGKADFGCFEGSDPPKTLYCIIEVDSKEYMGKVDIAYYQAYGSYGFLVKLKNTDAPVSLYEEQYYNTTDADWEDCKASTKNGIYPTDVKVYLADVKKLDNNYLSEDVVTDSKLSRFYISAGKKAGTVLGDSSTAEGAVTTSSGYCSHAEGFWSTASGNYSHAEGGDTTASGSRSHAEGGDTTASGSRSHAEGNFTVAYGESSHAEGEETSASGSSSHAEGVLTCASGSSSHAEGYYTTASGNHSHAEGVGTIASGLGAHVQGKYNIEDIKRNENGTPMLDNNGKVQAANIYAHIVGNGTSSARSNAHTLDWKGNAWYAGNITVGSKNKPIRAIFIGTDVPTSDIGDDGDIYIMY